MSLIWKPLLLLLKHSQLKQLSQQNNQIMLQPNQLLTRLQQLPNSQLKMLLVHLVQNQQQLRLQLVRPKTPSVASLLLHQHRLKQLEKFQILFHHTQIDQVLQQKVWLGSHLTKSLKPMQQIPLLLASQLISLLMLNQHPPLSKQSPAKLDFLLRLKLSNTLQAQPNKDLALQTNRKNLVSLGWLLIRKLTSMELHPQRKDWVQMGWTSKKNPTLLHQ